MRLDINTAIGFILALPAHRSNNQGHQKLGSKTLDYLLEFKMSDDITESNFNKEVIVAILSGVRAFSVERDALAGRWNSIKEIKEKTDIFIKSFKKFLPFEKDNYWAKLVSIVPTILVIIKSIINSFNFKWYEYVLVVCVPILLLQTIGMLAIFIAEKKCCEKLDNDKDSVWQSRSLNKYQHIVKCFIEEYIDILQKYYPDIKKLRGYDINKKNEIELLKDELINKHFYLVE